MKPSSTLTAEKLHALHEYIEKVLESLEKYCFETFPFTTKCESHLEAHLVISWYIAELPGGKDLLRIEHDVKRLFLAHYVSPGRTLWIAGV